MNFLDAYKEAEAAACDRASKKSDRIEVIVNGNIFSYDLSEQEDFKDLIENIIFESENYEEALEVIRSKDWKVIPREYPIYIIIFKYKSDGSVGSYYPMLSRKEAREFWEENKTDGMILLDICEIWVKE